MREDLVGYVGEIERIRLEDLWQSASVQLVDVWKGRMTYRF